MSAPLSSSSSSLRARFASVSSRRGVNFLAGVFFSFCASARFGGGVFGWAAAEGPDGGVGSAAADGPVGGADEPREDRDRGVDGVFARSRSGVTGVGVKMMGTTGGCGGGGGNGAGVISAPIDDGVDDAPRVLRDRDLGSRCPGGGGGGCKNGGDGISASLGEGVAPRLLLDRGVGGKLCVRRTPCMGTVGGGGAGGAGGMETELVLEVVGVSDVGESTRIGS